MRDDPDAAFAIIAPPAVLRRAARDLGMHAPLAILDTESQAMGDGLADAIRISFQEALPLLPLNGSQGTAGEPDTASASVTIASIERAVDLALSGAAGAVVTNPISKALLYGAGFAHPGHTEFLAALASRHTGAPVHPVMMLATEALRVALATIHIPLARVPETLTAPLLTTVTTIVHTALKRDFGIDIPRIALAGLNPHAGEDGTIGTEERTLINPVAEALRGQGLSVTDARPGDTVFAEAVSGAHNAVIAMYHDQGLAPLKTLDFWGGANLTLGLPFIRTSPDHGTAYDAARDGTARPDSLLAALRFARLMAENRARS